MTHLQALLARNDAAQIADILVHYSDVQETEIFNTLCSAIHSKQVALSLRGRAKSKNLLYRAFRIEKPCVNSITKVFFLKIVLTSVDTNGVFLLRYQI